MPSARELDLARLRYKYETILELRLRKEAASPASELRALSLEFPGALRTLDTLTIASIHDRIEAIVSAELDPGQIAPWMIAELTFAQAMRGLLAAKAWLRGRKSVDAELVASFEREAKGMRDASLALSWSAELEAIAQPPSGRLVPMAIARVAAALSTSVEEATALLHRDDGRERDQDLLGVEDEVPPDVEAPVEADEALVEPPLPPLPSDFLEELSPLDEEEEEADEDSEPLDVEDDPEGFDDE